MILNIVYGKRLWISQSMLVISHLSVYSFSFFLSVVSKLSYFYDFMYFTLTFNVVSVSLLSIVYFYLCCFVRNKTMMMMIRQTR